MTVNRFDIIGLLSGAVLIF
ncbi:hypothetical protein [Serratia grimesii]